jgi:hypothetical protein
LTHTFTLALAALAAGIYTTIGFWRWRAMRRNAALDHFGHDPDALLLFGAENGSGSAAVAAWTAKAVFVLGWPILRIAGYILPVD